ncbi:stargazin related protein STG-1 isoform X2 [Megalopta genalis]|uniref:stargazin related protein STG-1 isoform X2 n=1 Tax=Megalopta genalis TaxID=115081 RepID=UPI003FCFA332
MTRGRLVVMSCCCWCCEGLGGAGSSSAGAGGVVSGASGGSVVVGSDASNAGGGGLGIASGLSAMLSLVVVTVAISTGEWLLTEEKLPKTSSNTSVEPDSKVTYSGLWRVCVAISSRMEYECSSIDYFPNEEYSPDPSDSTMAIPYAVTKSAMFFFAATSLLVVAEVCYFTAHVTHPRHRLCVFVAGVVFIVSGLLMLVGMVMYISVFKAEVGSKLRPRSSFQVRILIFAVREWLHHDRGRWHLRHILVYFLAPERTGTTGFQEEKLRGSVSFRQSPRASCKSLDHWSQWVSLREASEKIFLRQGFGGSRRLRRILSTTPEFGLS